MHTPIAVHIFSPFTTIMSTEMSYIAIHIGLSKLTLANSCRYIFPYTLTMSVRAGCQSQLEDNVQIDREGVGVRG